MTAPKKPTICLCMIVKNEARVIERCLASVRDVIDTWVISDTGSNDGTQDLIRMALAGIPGELHEEPWQNFGHNRSLNINHALGKADYLLFIDADMTVRRQGPLPLLTSDAYMIGHIGDLAYRIKRLVRGDMAWHYEGVTHEYLTTHQEHTTAHLDAWAIEHFADGGSRADKFTRDARLLRNDLQRDPTNSRTVFYLAQTLRDLDDTAQAIELYERRARMGGWEEEIYYSLLQSGVLKADSGDWSGGMEALTRAWETRPTRLEACYELVTRLRKLGHHHTAHSFARTGIDKDLPADDILFVHPWVYQWGLLFEYSITTYWTGDPEASVATCDQLLAIDSLPKKYREQTLHNREFGARQLLGRSTAAPAPDGTPLASSPS